MKNKKTELEILMDWVFAEQKARIPKDETAQALDETLRLILQGLTKNEKLEVGP